MITLLHKRIDQRMNLASDRFYNIVIESPIYMRNFLFSLKEQLDAGDEFLLAYDEKNNEVNLSKVGIMIESPLSISVDEKKVNLNIQKDIASHISYEKKEQFEILKKQIAEYISDITYDYHLQVDFDEEMNLSSFLKAISLSYEERSESYIDKLINHIKILSFVFGYKVFFFLNLHDFLSNEEIEIVFSQLNLLEISYLVVSSHVPKQKNDKEFLIIIDEDLCELHVE